MRPSARFIATLLAAAAALAVSACGTSAPPAPVRPPPATPTPPAPPPVPFQLTPTIYSALPGWADTDHTQALVAFKRNCETMRRRQADSPLPGGGQYGGLVRDWLPACDASLGVAPGGERAFFEFWFAPNIVSGPGETKLTAYYEPIIEARRAPEPGFSEPLLKRPADMVTVDLGAFAEAYDSEALRGAPRRLTGRISGQDVDPYPKREAIAPAGDQAIAWAHPADLYNLQVQGSGRMRFADGTESRAAFAAQNGYRWNSALGALRTAGRLATVTWNGFRQWLDQNPGETRWALNNDPSYVFFAEETVTDFSAGPRGAANIPLTPMGSVAVDPAYHPYGAIVFVDGTYADAPFRRLLVAQDTGGAIRRGPLRGDVFVGSGAEAGAWAEQMNGPARWWTLIPRAPEQPIAALNATPSG